MRSTWFRWPRRKAASSLPHTFSTTASPTSAGSTRWDSPGSGVTVAVIDSGIRPGFPHLTLDGSVVGCEDFVGDALGCSNAGNNGHGTFVAGMISANVNFTLLPGQRAEERGAGGMPRVLFESADEHD